MQLQQRLDLEQDTWVRISPANKHASEQSSKMTSNGSNMGFPVYKVVTDGVPWNRQLLMCASLRSPAISVSPEPAVALSLGAEEKTVCAAS